MTKKQELAVSEEFAKEMAAMAAQDAAQERPAVSYISLKSGVLTYMGNPAPNNEIDVIILGHAVERALYTKPYDPDNITPPDCYAVSLTDTDLVPADNVPSPTHPTCKGCPKNEWNTATNGGRGKACGEKRRLLMVPASVLTDGLDGAEMAMMKVPVMSIKNFSKYVNEVRANTNRPVWGVVTTIKVVPDVKSQFRVTFQQQQTINSMEHLQQLKALNATSDIYTMQQFDMDEPAEEEDANSDKF